MDTEFLRDNQDMKERFDELIEGIRERFEDERCYTISLKEKSEQRDTVWQDDVVTLKFEFVKPYEPTNPETGHDYIDETMGRNY